MSHTKFLMSIGSLYVIICSDRVYSSMVEQRPFKPLVAGSSPAGPTLIQFGTHFPGNNCSEVIS